MKDCLICLASVEDQHDTCPLCGECSWAETPAASEKTDGEPAASSEKKRSRR